MLWMWIYWSQDFRALSKIQNIVYGRKRAQNEELGHKRHTLRKELSSHLWRLISCGSENPVQQLDFLKMPQSHSISVPQPPTILFQLGIIFFSPVTLLPAVLYLRCNALPPPHLLKHELSYWDSSPFQGLEVLEMTRTDFPMGAVWRSSDTFPTFIVCVSGLLDMKLTGNRSSRWNCEVCSDWSQEVCSLVLPLTPLLLLDPSDVTTFHLSSVTLQRPVP